MLDTQPVETYAPTGTAELNEAPAPRDIKVCMLAACPFPANHGTPGSIREMSESLVEEGYETHIVTYHFGEEIPVKGPLVHRIPALTGESQIVVGPTTRRPLYDLQMVFTATRVIRDHKLDVIHAHGYEAALVGWLCHLMTRKPMVYSGHNTMMDELPSYNFIRPQFAATALARLLDLTVPRLADRCLPHSGNIQAFFEQQGLLPRTDPVVNFGIEIPDRVEPDHAVRDEYGIGSSPLVLYAGVMDRFQRLDLLIDAMSDVISILPDARLMLVRTVPNPEQLTLLRLQAEEYGISDRVIVTESLPLPEVLRLVSACDVAVVPRPATPGFPIKLLNYMAAARPVVMFASSASGLQHGKHAWLAQEDTAGELGAGLLKLLLDHHLREEIGRQGRAYVEVNHDRRRIAHNIVQSYRRALRRAT